MEKVNNWNSAKKIFQWAGEIGCVGSHYVNKNSEFYEQYKEIEKKV
jgi:hypothetical protein